MYKIKNLKAYKSSSQNLRTTPNESFRNRKLKESNQNFSIYCEITNSQAYKNFMTEFTYKPQIKASEKKLKGTGVERNLYSG